MLAGFYRVYSEVGVGAIFENDVIIYFDLNEKRPMRFVCHAQLENIVDYIWNTSNACDSRG